MISSAINYGRNALQATFQPRSTNVNTFSTGVSVLARGAALAYGPFAMNRAITQTAGSLGGRVAGQWGASAARFLGTYVATPLSYVSVAPQILEVASNSISTAAYYAAVPAGNLTSWAIQRARISNALRTQQATAFEYRPNRLM